MKTGIYRIHNLVDNKVYIGSTMDSFNNRWTHHRGRLRANQHCNPKLQNAWNRHSEAAFVFEILLYCDPEDCLTFEQMAIDCYQPEYNICLVAGNRKNYVHSDQTKQRISNALRGRKFSALHRRHLSKSKEGRLPQHLRDCDHSGSKNGRAVITEEQARAIKVLLDKGLSQQKIANKFGVQQTLVSRIKRGVSWSHV